VQPVSRFRATSSCASAAGSRRRCRRCAIDHLARLIAILLLLLAAGACSKAPAASPPAAADGSVDATAAALRPARPEGPGGAPRSVSLFLGSRHRGLGGSGVRRSNVGGTVGGPVRPEAAARADARVNARDGLRRRTLDAAPAARALRGDRCAARARARAARRLRRRVRRVRRRSGDRPPQRPASAPATGAPLLASAPHGPEVERIYIPVRRPRFLAVARREPARGRGVSLLRPERGRPDDAHRRGRARRSERCADRARAVPGRARRGQARRARADCVGDRICPRQERPRSRRRTPATVRRPVKWRRRTRRRAS
jgi:hypothetical protein